MKRYVILVGCLAVDICLGGVYAWSVFVPWLVHDYGLTTTQTQSVFGAAIAVLAAVGVYGGRVVERRGPRAPLLASGVLFAAGYGVAAASGLHYAGLLVGIGLLGGAALGMGYVVPLAVAVKWFPDHKGLITGVTVAGFGSGAIVLSTLAQRLEGSGVSVPSVFLIVGLAYGITILIAGLLLSVPATDRAVERRQPPVRRIVRQPLFWGCEVGMFGGTFAGLMVIGNLKPYGLDEGVGAAAATAAISGLAVGNALGRVTWGWLYDHAGRVTIPASLLFLGAAMVLLSIAGSDAAFVATTAAVGFCFGACFVLYAAELTSRWGVEAMGGVYPLIILAYGVSGVLGPVTGGWLFDTTGTYGVAILIAAGLSAASGVAFLFLRRTESVTVDTAAADGTQFGGDGRGPDPSDLADTVDVAGSS